MPGQLASPNRVAEGNFRKVGAGSAKVLTALFAPSQRGLKPVRLDGDMPGVSRVEAGRRRAKAAKRAVALTAAAGFAVVLALARQGHPATGASSTRSAPHSTGTSSPSLSQSGSTLGGGSVAPSSGGSSRSGNSEDDDTASLGGGSLAPPSSAKPPVATHTS